MKKESIKEDKDIKTATGTSGSAMHKAHSGKSAKPSNGKKKTAREKASEKLSDLKTELHIFQDKYLRLAAEFENYKKRRMRAEQEHILATNEAVLAAFLPVLDDLYRTLDSADNEKDVESLREGIKLVIEKFENLLESHGVKPIEAIGEPFNPECHEAMMVVKSDEHDPDMVVSEFERGFTYGGRVLRPAKVQVSGSKDGG